MEPPQLTELLRDCIGRPALTLVPKFFQLLPGLQALRLVAYRPAPTLGERLQSETGFLCEVNQEAAMLHEKYGVAFWDAVLGMALQRGELGSAFLPLALTHDAAADEREYRFSQEEIESGGFDRFLATPPPGYGVALSSRIEFADGAIRHLPMLDFRCPHSAHAAGMLRAALLAMGQRRGILVRSPRSYHYYGLDPVNENGLTQFLAQALLIAPIVDARYIAHRLLDGACRLRVSAAAGKGEAPRVEAILVAD